MSFMDFTGDFIKDFTAVFIKDFTANFMLNPPDFIIWFHEKFHYIYQDFTEINRISWNPQHFTEFHWNQQDFIMDFTVDSIPVKSVMKFIMKSANEIHSEIYNEILPISVKSLEFNEVLWNAVDFMKSCDILWISWNPIAFSKILLDLMDLIKSFEISRFNEILLLLIKLCWISWNHVKSCWILWNLVKSCGFMKSSRFQFKSCWLQVDFR